MELCGVCESELGGLPGHSLADFEDAVADGDHGGLAAGIEVTAAGLVDDPAAFAACGNRIGFAQISGEEGGIGRHDDAGIVAEGKLGWMPRIDDGAEMGCSRAAPLLGSVIRWRAFCFTEKRIFLLG